MCNCMRIVHRGDLLSIVMKWGFHDPRKKERKKMFTSG